MDKQISEFDNLPYFSGLNEMVLTSDVIDALTQLKEEFGDIPVRLWGDGIFKNVRLISVRTTWDKTKKAIEIS